MEIAERYVPALRAWLRSADRFNDRAIRFGSLQVNTFACRSSA
jgi:hypothetical protein